MQYQYQNSHHGWLSGHEGDQDEDSELNFPTMFRSCELCDILNLRKDLASKFDKVIKTKKMFFENLVRCIVPKSAFL
jgi:hypothetical protein